jgi:mxaJ protein
MPSLSFAHVAAIFAICIASSFAGAHESSGAEAQRTFIVAADPNNMPFSNDREEGFENKLAKILARDLRAELKYVWQPQRRGFIKDTLGSGRCDAVMGVPTGLPGCLTSQPYYQSSYVFVIHQDRNQSIHSLDDRALQNLKIGVQLMGDGQMSPPAYALVERGLANNLVGFSMYGDGRSENPTAEIIRALGSNKIDVAIAWGAMAGYFARESTDLVAKPIPQPPTSPVPYRFDICIAIRKDEPRLLEETNSILRQRKGEIAAVLNEFAVPRFEDRTKLSDTSNR